MSRVPSPPVLPERASQKWLTEGAEQAEAYRAQVIALGHLPKPRVTALDVQRRTQRVMASLVLCLSLVAMTVAALDLGLLVRGGPG